MILPKEEQNVLNELYMAHGKPLRAAEIADKLGIQDNHCVKLIKYLTDKGYLNKDHRRFVEIDGKQKSYKEYWIPSEIEKILNPITQVNDLSENSPDKCYNRLPNGDICGSYFRRGKECNICQK